jgi:hypothetical protein
MFKRSIALVACLLVLIASSASAQTAVTPGSGRVVVHKGVVLRLSNVTPLDSATAKPGDAVVLKVARALVVDGVTLVPEGEIIYGKVTKARHAGKDCHNGFVKLKIESIVFPDATKADTHLLFAAAGQNVSVPDVLQQRHHHLTGGQIAEGIPDAMQAAVWTVVLAPLVIIFLPSILDQQAEDKAKACGGRNGQEYLLPESSTVAVVISKDHVVRY